MSHPSRRKNSRSAIVAFEPGRMTSAASRVSGCPGRTMTSSTSGSARSGSRSSKLAMRGNIGTAIRTAALTPALSPPARRGRTAQREGEGQARASPRPEDMAEGKNGTVPKQRNPVRALIAAMPPSNSRTSPRNLLTMYPASSARSVADSSACVPTSWAITPPRSISPTSTTGISAASANPIFAMSPSRRLISAGLPAPSTRTRSAASARREKEPRIAGNRLGASRRYSPAPAARQTRPCSTICAPLSDCGFNSTGFMSVTGAVPQARACNACARPISPPSAVTAALFDMFCGLNGRTRSPCRVKARANPASSSDLPTSDPVPCSISARAIRTRSPAAP